MLVIALDTSTPVLTAGVAEVAVSGSAGPMLLAESWLIDKFAHAEQLIPLLQQALAAAGRTLAQVDAVVVGLGPGPFTGLRVGIASAAALGDGLGVEVYGVPSHDAFARAGGLIAAEPFLVATDARRKEVYLSGYADGELVLGPIPIAPAGVADWLVEHDFAPRWVTGAGAGLIAGLLSLPEQNADGAVTLGLVAAALPAISAGRPPAPLTPLYLRRPDAVPSSAIRKSVLG